MPMSLRSKLEVCDVSKCYWIASTSEHLCSVPGACIMYSRIRINVVL